MTDSNNDDDFLFSGGIDDNDFLLAAEEAVKAQISPPQKFIPSAVGSKPSLFHLSNYVPESDDDDYGSDIDISELSPPLPNEVPDLKEEHELLHHHDHGAQDDDFAPPDDLLPLPGEYNSSQDLIDSMDHQIIDLTSSPIVPPELSSSQTCSYWEALIPKASPKRGVPQGASPSERQKVVQEPKSLSRPPFPAIVLDNSLVDGLTPRRYIRSCFCIASAIQLAENGDDGRVKNDVLIELYARVSFSSRTPPKQYFQFIDLMHDDPPYLNGFSETYKRCELWTDDAGSFLKSEVKGKIAKVVGKMRKTRVEGDSTPWHFEVLGIQEITWQDVCELKVAVTGRSTEEMALY